MTFNRQAIIVRIEKVGQRFETHPRRHALLRRRRPAIAQLHRRQVVVNSLRRDTAIGTILESLLRLQLILTAVLIFSGMSIAATLSKSLQRISNVNHSII